MEQRTATGRERSAALDSPRVARFQGTRDADSTGGEAARDGERPAGAVTQTARALSERAGDVLSMLREEGMGGIAEDLADLVRRYPWQAMLIGFTVGYLISRGKAFKTSMR